MVETVRPLVSRLATFAPMKPEEEWTQDELEEFEALVIEVLDVLPLRDVELPVLLPLFDRPSRDDVYGMCETIKTIVETTPNYDSTIERYLANYDTGPTRPWFEELLLRHDNARRLGLS